METGSETDWCFISSALGPVAVAETLYRLDRLFFPVLLAQLVSEVEHDVHESKAVDAVTGRVEVVPNRLLQLVEGEHLTLVADQRGEHEALPRGQVDGLPVDGDLALAKSTCKVPSSKVVTASGFLVAGAG